MALFAFWLPIGRYQGGRLTVFFESHLLSFPSNSFWLERPGPKKTGNFCLAGNWLMFAASMSPNLMHPLSSNAITVKTTINAPVSTVWNRWTDPAHITQWCFATDDWEAPYADNDVQVGGSFTTTMAAKDKSFSFDFGGVYSAVVPEKELAYAMDDGRKVYILFEAQGETTTVTETFEPELQNDPEMQRAGWQAILDNFKRYAERP